MAAAILGTDADRDAFINREALRHAVSHRIFCERTGAVLDVRTAVLFTVSKGEKRGAMVLTGTAWDAIAERMTALADEAGATVQLIDGRQLNRRRTTP
jgi:hypothetical protein